MTDAFTHQIFRIVIAKMLKQFKFATASESSLDVLVDTTISHLFNIAKQAANRAANCGRTDANAYDLIISLAEYQIPFQHLVGFFTKELMKVPLSPFDFLILPYPIAQNSNFYQKQASSINKSIYERHQNQIPHPTTYQTDDQKNAQQVVDAIVNDIFVPFRANTTINYFQPNCENLLPSASSTNDMPQAYNQGMQKGNYISMPTSSSRPLFNPNNNNNNNNSTANENEHLSYIPTFFPTFPPKYTYDETPMKETLSIGEAAILDKMHEDDQRESKESLAQLNKSSIDDQRDGSEAFEMILHEPPEINIPIGKFAEEKKSGIYVMDGERPAIDPEFMTPLKIKDDIVYPMTLTKDVKMYISILKNKHNESKGDNESKNDD